MADLIRHKRSDVPAAVPAAGDLELGELAINVADGRLYFKKSNGDIIAVANLADAWALQPIGVPFDIWTHLPGVELPPTDNPSYRYIKLTASDSYNDGVLTSESVSGSAPLVQATAVIDYPDSPFDGETVHLINTERRFLRPGSSGTVEQDAMQNITGSITNQQEITGLPIVASGAFGKSAVTTPIASRTGASVQIAALSVDFDASRVVRTANETRVKGIGADVFMRIR
jgi:hypothetical protein